MTKRLVLVLGLAAAVLAAGWTADAVAGKRAARPATGKAKLAAAADTGAKGTADVKHWPETGQRVERSRLRIRVRKLVPNASYVLWLDDPRTPDMVPVQFTYTPLTSDVRGKLTLTFDTKQGDALPFGALVDDLLGCPVQLRTPGGQAVLVGKLPVMR